MGSPKFLSRQAESCQCLEYNFTPYCIGIKHKYTTVYFALNAPFFYPLTLFLLFFVFCFFQMDIENDKLEKTIGLFSRCKETLLMYSMTSANMMVKY